jgi:hypothetical protein
MFRQLLVIGGMAVLLVGCSDKPELQRLMRERALDKLDFEKEVVRLGKQFQEDEQKQTDQIEQLQKQLKTAQDRLKTQEKQLAASKAKRTVAADEVVMAQLDFSTLKVCAMQGVMCLAKAGDLQRAEAYAAFLAKSLKGDEDVVKLKAAIAAQRAALEKEPPEKK